MNREELLNTAKQMVCGKRETDYGSPEDNFSLIGEFWSTYLEIKINAQDVANMMCLMKLARIKSGHGTMDSYIDLAGYAACGGEILSNKEEK